MSPDRRVPTSTAPAVAAPALGASGWRPLLTGRAAADTWDAITAISDELGAYYRSQRRTADATLAGGAAGAALFFDALAQAGDDASAGRRNLTSALLREAAGSLSTGVRGVGLLEGVAGVIWAVTLLRGSELDLSTEVSLAQIDASLLAYLSRTPWTDAFDLIGGLVGLGVYGLERLPRPAAVRCVEQVVARLDELAEWHADGVTWRTPPALLPDGQRERLPNGWYNLGVAHGIPGVIGLLAGAVSAGVAVDRARPLLHGAVSWLMAQQLPDGGPARFPHCVAPELDNSPSRLSWCFGDAGIAATLLLAARAERRPDWERAAIEIAHQAAARSLDGSGVEDAGLCHGAAGLVHILNRLHQATADPALAAAARAWFARTLQLRRTGEAFAGFPSCEPDATGARVWTADPGVLTGAAGVGLALLAAVTDIEPGWDRALLLSLRSDRAPVAESFDRLP